MQLNQIQLLSTLSSLIIIRSGLLLMRYRSFICRPTKNDVITFSPHES